MSIVIVWDNPEHTIVRWDFDGRWDWLEYSVAQEESNRLVQSEKHVVDVIGDVSRSPTLPSNAFTKYLRFKMTHPDNLGQIVLVGASPLVQTMVRMFGKVFPKISDNFQFAATLDEARNLLWELRSPQSVYKTGN